MHLTKPISPARVTPRFVGFMLILAVIVALVMLAAFGVDAAQRTKQQQEHAVAAYWQQAGISGTQSIIKDDHTKRTTGTLGGCNVVVEGFDSYTSVTLHTDGPHVVIHEERFTPIPGTAAAPAVSSDVAAATFVHSMAAQLPAYCTAG